jgi:solute:Na+ symporter, SSS family
VGELVVIWLTFWAKGLTGNVNVGLVGLGANLAVLALAATAERLLARNAPSDSATDESVAVTA